MKRPVRFFNTTGPCHPDDHYMLPPKDRLRGAQLHRYVRDKLYWMLHAPRQTGKTTFLFSWMRELNAAGEVVACYVSIEDCQGMADVSEAMRIMDFNIRTAFKEMGLPPPTPETSDPLVMVAATLRQMAAMAAPKPLIMLFDETDVLEGEPLIRFLRLLRNGFAGRGIGLFPTSIALVGMRDLKDYLAASKGGVPVNPGSPFNIKEDSVMLDNFSREDIAGLFTQRTVETGQHVSDAALDYVWEESHGQPWIVNSLFQRATMRVLDEDDYSPVELTHVMAAREQMILARETHLESLAWRMDDERVRHVLEVLLTGVPDMNLARSDAFRLCLDLGLVAERDGVPTVANPIYREILAREMSIGAQAMMPPRSEFRWQKADGRLDMDALLKEFQRFWRRNSEIWEIKSDYTEAFPHLLLMAFLQRLTNGEGRIDREYAAGRGRLDLLVEYHGDRFIIEVKLLRDYDTLEVVRDEGLEQIRRYRDQIGGEIPCYLMIFDRRAANKKLPWNERISWQKYGDVDVVGC